MQGLLKYRTTVGSSLIASGVVTLLLAVLPGNSVWWGVGFLVVGFAVFVVRREAGDDDATDGDRSGGDRPRRGRSLS